MDARHTAADKHHAPGKAKNKNKKIGNSKAFADAQETYEPVAHPTTVEGIVNTVNMWAYYVYAWGERASADIEALESRVSALEKSTKKAQTHVGEPPDPPYDPPVR